MSEIKKGLDLLIEAVKGPSMPWWLSTEMRDAVVAAKLERERLRARVIKLERDTVSRAEISERYMELPVDRNGVPIRPGDTVYGQDGKAWHVKHVGSSKHCVNGVNGREMRQMKAGWLSHVKPWGYETDAHGVELKPGDKVWPIDENLLPFRGLPLTVEGRMNEDGTMRVLDQSDIANDDPEPWNVLPENLIHAEPDSWERLEEDASMQPYAYCVSRCLLADPEPTNEKFAGDLIRRAKKLAGVDGR